MAPTLMSARQEYSRRLPCLVVLIPLVVCAASPGLAAPTPRVAKLASIRAPRRRAVSPLERLAELRAGIERARAAAAASTPNIAAEVPKLGCGEWTELSPNAVPLGLFEHSMIYDPVRDRLVVYGGVTLTGELSGDVWTLDLSAPSVWTLLATSGDIPEPRYDHTAVYDPSGDRMIVFAGIDLYDGSNDVFALDLSTATWTQLAPAGTPPTSRYAHASIYDSSRDRMVVFGGADYNGNYNLNDVWSLTLSGAPTWTQLSPSGTPPYARYEHTAIYDAPRDRMIVFGGVDDLSDTWSLSFPTEAWTELLPTGTLPNPRSHHAALFDAPRNRMIMFGGLVVDDNGDYFDTSELWSLPLTGTLKWAKLNPPASPPPLESPAIVYDPLRQRLLSFGGYYNATADQLLALNLSGGPAWTEIPSQSRPRQRSDHTAICDAERHRMVIYGGASESGNGLNDAWTFDLSGSLGWTKLTPTTPGPPRYYQAAALDSVHDRLIVFSGYDENGHLREDVWALSLSGTPNWTKLNPSGGQPAPRSDACAMYDPGRGRIVVHGGVDSMGTVLDDTWALSLSGGTSWTQLSPGGSGPPAFSDHAVIYDRPRDRMIVLAGNDANSDAQLWQLSFAGAGTWSPIATTNEDPIAYGPQAVFDGARNRMLAFCAGFEIYALPLAGTPAWSRIGAAPTLDLRDYATVIFDAEHDQAVMFGGYGVNDVQAFTNSGNFLPFTAVPLPSLGGTVIIEPEVGCYAAGTEVTVTATPVPGFEFTGWSGDASGMVNPLTVTVNAGTSIFANFAQPPPTCDGWRLLLLQSGDLPIDYTSMVHDPVRHRMLALGSGSTGYEVWQLPLAGPADWQRVVTAGELPPRYYAQAVYDPVRDRVLVYGGTDFNTNDYDDVWALSLTGTPTWSQVIAPGSGGGLHVFGSLTYDPVRDRLIVYGGRANYYSSIARGDIRVLPLTGTPAWSQITPAGNQAPPRYGHTAIYDPVRDRLVVFGGFESSGISPSAVMRSLTLSGTPMWGLLGSVGQAPPALGLAVAIYDPLRDRMVLFGGSDRDPFFYYYAAPFDHVFSLSFHTVPATWSQLSPDGTLPGPRVEASASYDADNDRLVVANGIDFLVHLVHGSHALSLGGGLWLETATNPVTAGYVDRATDCIDPHTSVMLSAVAGANAAFVGWSGDASGTDNPLKVTMDGNKTIVANFDVPVPTLLAVFEAERRDGAVQLHWEFSSPALVATWSVERARQATGPWEALALEARPEGSGLEAVDPTADPAHDYLYRLQASLQSGGEMTFGPVAVEAVGRLTRSDLALRSSNPATGDVRFDVSLARAGMVRVAVYDVAGREVAVLADGTHDAGTFSLAWDGRARGRLAAGLYIVRLSAPDRAITRRVTLVH